MSGAPAFTVLAPVHRPPDLLPFAINSVLRQSRQDFEVFIICDGAPPATAAAARRFEAEDERIRAFIHPKGERHGEAHRHLALAEARGRIVCQIGDDDLWFPDHLAEADALMATVDFGASLPLYLLADGSPRLHFSDLADGAVQSLMREGRGNAFGPTPSAYRLETYRALPVGWSPAPEGAWTDLFMWRKFLALPGVRCGTGFTATTLSFPQALRRDWSLDRRRDEIAAHAAQVEDPTFRDRLWRDALKAAARQSVAVQAQTKLLKDFGRQMLDAVAEAEGALTQIAAAGHSDTQAELARAALARLPDRAWREKLGARPSTPRKGT